MTEEINGKCVQLIPPSKTDRYIIPTHFRIFGDEGYHIATVRQVERSKWSRLIRSILPVFREAEIRIAISDPDFEEGDEVGIDAEQVGDSDIYASPNPFNYVSSEDSENGGDNDD